jgi:probable rRNA maturation factor
MVTVSVESRQRKLRLNLPRISEIAGSILRQEGVKDANLTIVFVTAKRMRSYNNRFLSRNYATDVLAFDLSEEGGASLVGDIVISTDAALKNAKFYGQTPARELCLYVIHGILHLTGYDDKDEAGVQRMGERQEELLAQLGRRAESVLA